MTTKPLEVCSAIGSVTGIGAKTAAGADEAIALLKSGSFNLVLSDITMPGKCGLDLSCQQAAEDQVRIQTGGHSDCVAAY